MKRGNKNFTKLICMAGCLVLAMTLFAGCKKAATEEGGEATVAPTTAATAEPTVAATEAPKEVTMTTGYYEDKFTPPGYSEFVSYIRFYDNGVFYSSFYNNGQFNAGYYEVVDEPMDYDSDPGDAEVLVSAPQTVKLTNVDGSEFASIAYDQDTLMNVTLMYGHNFLHITDTPHTSADETGVTIDEFVLGDDTYSTVAIKHNGTFQDTISTMLEGTWAKDGNVYTLTDSSTNDTYTVTISEDGKTGEYVGLDGTTQTLNMTQMKGEPVYTFNGTGTDEAGDLTVTVVCLDNGKATIKAVTNGANIGGNGTWEQTEDKSTVTITVGANTYTATNADGVYSFDYVASNGTNDVTATVTTAAQ